MIRCTLCLLLGTFLLFAGSQAAPAEAGLPFMAQGGEMPTLAPLLKKVTPGVVNIATRGHVKMEMSPLFQDPFFRRFFGVPDQPVQRRTQSVGSGVIIDNQRGHVVTNHHVIKNADQIVVTLKDGRRFEAKHLGSDPETDLAILQIEPEDLTAVPIGDSDTLEIGDFAIAIGNPFGLGQTVTSGIISALGRTGLGIEGYEDFIQTDASINPGNSGGALVNLRGELIGINTAIIGPGGGNVGIGFAIPINMAQRIIDQIVKYGEVERGRLGVEVQDLTPALAEAFEVDLKKGAVIAAVEPGSAADKAGLKAGDIVVSVDESPVRGGADLRNKVGLVRVGERVRMEVLRDGLKVKIEALVEQPHRVKVGQELENSMLAGVVLGPIEPGSKLYGRVQGVAVYDVAPASPAGRAGLRPGDIIISINRRRVQAPEDVLEALRASPRGLQLRVQRGNRSLFMIIR